MPITPRKTNEVLDSARKDLQAQLDLVRDEMGRLAAEEHALTQALSSLNGGSTPSSSAPAPARSPGEQARTAKGSAAKRSARSTATRRRRRPRNASKSTPDRVKDLQGLLADGPKSRTQLAAALKVSPARVQQLLAELGSAVSSQPDPAQRQGKLWSLKGSGNGAGAAKRTAKGGSTPTKGAATRKTSTRTKPAGKIGS